MNDHNNKPNQTPAFLTESTFLLYPKVWLDQLKAEAELERINEELKKYGARIE